MTFSKNIKFNFLNTDEQERYQKHLTLKDIGYEGQLELKNCSVLCIGAGGLGSSVLLYLAATGIGKIGIVDNDYVEKSNLQRQIIHETNTIGNLKIESAQERIKKLNPNSEVLTYEERINPENALKIIRKFDIICDCSDNFGTRYLINDACLILKKPLVFGSVQGFEGQVSVFNLYKNSPNLRDLLPESPVKNAIPSCSEYGVLGISTGLIGIFQVNEIIKIILKKGEILDGKILVFDLLNMNMKKLHLKSAQVNKRIKDLSQFADFYNDDECSEKNSEIKRIDANDFNSLYKTKPNKILLIDVRENEEFSTSAIEGSISIPLSHLQQESDLKFIQKESLIKEIFTICKSGKRSEKASKILSKFKIQSRSIVGGIEKVKKILSN
ncbi:molybdenum cofactor biosynthesis protein MoeB [Prochlorococcus marinus str. MU1404]|uniref:ThiF family adenylyltransferase n=1 Tax=Prochlorococcus marinus TaxID=1219 RepID=UPI001AD98E33|nr:ThiF family adenylyltransferase [Prochlorococcus marinus]MBO8230868.1 molybdenum cofactor biosynthesis protein MoeB [Prochlorococcus marinus XMU1404]MBW3073901.1 molybdenum cofactor biosynthesis protein MoeB [Prochlorococcus marinus str. MU1404]MCR8544800.1 ThiF family adenylyltransferase [Prochlorococcus marinus CUG1432]